MIKSYASCLVGELSQLCYTGVYRSIALGSTDALCTWRCYSFIALQPVIVPVGRIALGRIFNVVGSIIDPYMELCYSCQFNKSIISSILCKESSANCYCPYPNHVFIKASSIFIGLHEHSTSFLEHISNILHNSIIYIAYLYLNIEQQVISQHHTSSISLNIISHFYSTDTLNYTKHLLHFYHSALTYNYLKQG